MPALPGEAARGWDKTAPRPVARFAATRTKEGLLQVTWRASSDRDLRYYNLYASSQGEPEVSQPRLLVSPAHDQTSYLDWSAGKAEVMHYAITAVDRQGNESAPVFAHAD